MSMWTEDHDLLRKSVRQFVKTEINPYVDEWEAEGMFPAHEVFKKAGDLGILGLNRPEEFGGSGLDYSFNVACA